MHEQASQTPRATDLGHDETEAAASRGIGFPRTYDLLLRIMTRGREKLYRRNLLDLADIAPGQSVLDIGCGTGTQAIAIHRRVQPGGSVIGVDISRKMLAAASRKARRAGADIVFRWADATRLPFEDGGFDVVTVTTVLHMVPSDQRCLCVGEAARVLKRGGRLLLIDYAGKPEERRHWTARHGRHGAFDLHGLRGTLAEAGLSEVDSGPLNWLSLHFLRATRR
jgi:ubiquinone/menaquinone biosynthesis C-methylase UbiE